MSTIATRIWSIVYGKLYGKLMMSFFKNRPSCPSTVRPILCKDLFQIRTLVQLFHRTDSKPWFRQHLREEFYCKKFRRENRKLCQSTLYEIVSKRVSCSFRFRSFLGLCSIQNKVYAVEGWRVSKSEMIQKWMKNRSFGTQFLSRVYFEQLSFEDAHEKVWIAPQNAFVHLKMTIHAFNLLTNSFTSCNRAQPLALSIEQVRF